MIYRELNNLSLTRLYEEAHKKLGERTLWLARCEEEINTLLRRIARARNVDYKYDSTASELKERLDTLYMHKNAAFEAALSIYELEAEMDRRTYGSNE